MHSAHIFFSPFACYGLLSQDWSVMAVEVFMSIIMHEMDGKQDDDWDKGG